jgi:hypothetical protein
LANLLLANTVKASGARVVMAVVQGACLAAAGLFLLLAFYNVLILVLPVWGAFFVLAGLFLTLAFAAHFYAGRLHRLAQLRRTSYLQGMAGRASAVIHLVDALRRGVARRKS